MIRRALIPLALVAGGGILWVALRSNGSERPGPIASPSTADVPEHLQPLLTRLHAKGGTASLDSSAQHALQQGLGTSDRYGVSDDAAGVPVAQQAGFSARFTRDGVTLTDGGEDWSMALQGVSCDGVLTPTRRSEPRRQGEHVIYDRSPAIQEWYASGEQGLEQGFTLRQAPCGDGPIVLALAVSGSGTTRHDAAEGALYLSSKSGIGGLRYGDLYVYDSTGERIPATLESPEAGTVHLRVRAAGAQYPVYVDPWVVSQTAYVKASNTWQVDNFGWSVAVDGTTLVIGADLEDSNGTDQTNDGATNAGAAYVFVRTDTGWSQQAYLKASNAEEYDRFGYAVAIDSDTIVVGAPYEDSSSAVLPGNNARSAAGAAYVFVRSGTTWTQQAYLKAEYLDINDTFGLAVAIDNDTIIVGAPAEESNATGVNQNASDDSAPLAGAAYVFVRSAGVWSQQAYLKASNTEENDTFGASVALDGDTAIVGATDEESNSILDQSNNSLARAGAVYVFLRSGTNWSQQAYLKASNIGIYDEFGTSVSISGETIVVGAPFENSNATGINGNQANESAGDAGAVYVIERNGTTWSQQAYIKASNTNMSDRFGGSVGIDGDTLVVGAFLEDSNASGIDGNQSDDNASGAGAAYLFTRQGDTWTQSAYIKASNTAVDDNFGRAVALDGDAIVVGAHQEDSATTGINNDQSSNTSPNAGAAYVFHLGGFTERATVDANVTGNCSNGGKRILIYDDDGAGDATANDGVYEADEIDETYYLCAGTTGSSGSGGATGTTGPTGASGPSGGAGTNGSDGAAGPSGSSGPQGAAGASPSGPSGPTGTPGTSGAAGATGPSGPSGAAGVDGIGVGATGPTGPSGPSGVGGAGASGPSGPTGAAGPDGASGPSGPSLGPSGATGPTGPTGVGVGASGPSGPAGADGTAGTPGANGPTGPTGPAGAAGATGAKGPSGPATGPIGPAGTDGLVGDLGPTGPTGPKGPSGATGAEGQGGNAAATCTIVDNGDGTRTITCVDGTTATFGDGNNGANGRDGAGGGCAALPGLAPFALLAVLLLVRRRRS